MAFVLAALLTAACGRSPGCGAPSPSGAATASAPASASASVAAPGASVRLVGRFEPPPPSGGATPASPASLHARFAWSGSSFEVRFKGSPTLTMRLGTTDAPGPGADAAPPVADGSLTYSVEIDDRAPVTLDLPRGQQAHELASGLDPDQPHLVRVVREAEAFGGVHELLGVDLAPGGSFLPPRPRKFRIEAVGDSITCGYGVLGEGACHFSFVTERASQTYAARLGRMLDADVTSVCWSGRGVLRNYDGTTEGAMPALFETTLPSPPRVPWTFSTPPPDAVVVNLGTNDFLGAAGKPLDLAAFEAAYVTFTKRLRELYPAAFLALTTSPMLRDDKTSSGPGTVKELARRSLERVVARRIGDGDSQVELVVLDTDAPHWGCDGHPDAAMNARMAAALAPVLRRHLTRSDR